MVIENACVIVAMRNLIGDPDWLPAEVAADVIINKGYPSNKNADLERLAPVRVFADCTIDVIGGRVKIRDDRGEVTLGDGGRIAIGRKTTPGRGHVECMTTAEAAALVADIADGRTVNNIYAVIVANPQQTTEGKP